MPSLRPLLTLPRRDPLAIRLVLLALCVGILLPLLAGCRTPPLQVRPQQANEAVVYLMASGWHTGLALPARPFEGPLRRVRNDFPRANYLLFGWGERDYYMASDPSSGDALRALLPGPAVILVTPLDRPPQTISPDTEAIALALSAAGFHRMADYIWAEFGKSSQGMPERIVTGPEPGSVFYAATRTYSAAFTCNTWTAQALQVGGLAFTAAGVVFAHQVVDQARHLLISAQ